MHIIYGNIRMISLALYCLVLLMYDLYTHLSSVLNTYFEASFMGHLRRNYTDSLPSFAIESAPINHVKPIKAE
jgi:hypothetical protein